MLDSIIIVPEGVKLTLESSTQDKGTMKNAHYHKLGVTFQDGGGAICNKGHLKVDNMNFLNNKVCEVNNSGGAIYSFSDNSESCSMTIENSNFDNNVAEQEGGGAISAWMKYGDITINGCRFTFNHCEIDGGAINTNHAHLKVSNSYFANNYAIEFGGAIRHDNDLDFQPLKVESSTFEYNHAGPKENNTSGGAIYAFSGIEIKSSKILHNSCITTEDNDSVGGGIYSGYTSLIDDDVEIAFNSAGNSGGGVCMRFGEPFTTIKGADIHDNTSSVGAGVFFREGAVKLVGTKIHDNIGSGVANFASPPSSGLILSGQVKIYNNIPKETNGRSVDLSLASALRDSLMCLVEFDNFTPAQGDKLNFILNDCSGEEIIESSGVLTSGYKAAFPGAGLFDHFVYVGNNGVQLFNNDGEIVLHKHTWVLSEEDEDTIQAHCTNEDDFFDCPYKEGHPVKLQILAKDVPYDGAEHPASLTNGFTGVVGDAKISAISYEGVDSTQYAESTIAPTEVGKYKSKIVVTSAEGEEFNASTTFSITESPVMNIPATGDIALVVFALFVVALLTSIIISKKNYKYTNLLYFR